jgi:hypothetical protein
LWCIDIRDDFEEAGKKADESFVKISGIDEERAEKFRRYWPMREGKFVLSVESCVYI